MQSASWLENNYGYGAANTLARPTSSDLLEALQLTNPRARQRAERAHRPLHPAAGACTRRLWEEVKAS